MGSKTRLTLQEKDSVQQTVRGIIGEHPEATYIQEMVVTVLRMAKEKVNRGDIKLVNTALKEMRYAFNLFSRYKDIPKVTAFGSARILPSAPEYKLAKRFGQQMAKAGYMMITGAADGIMRACNEGAGKAMSFGVNIRLPFEQSANEFVSAEKLINFKYFFTRKLFFVKESSAVALFPGGFGTMDEAFELFTLIQTGKANLCPIVLLDIPGGYYWKNWEAYIQKNMNKTGLISVSDMHLFHVTDDVDDAVEEITRFYRVYHSSRYVNERLVLRLKRPISDALLGKLNKNFSDIVSEGKIERTKALPAEVKGRDHVSLPRLIFSFNRKDLGVLRQLINQLNDSTKP